jgi:hypothetical protein
MIFQFQVYKNAFNFALPSWCADSYHHFDRAFDTPLLIWGRPLASSFLPLSYAHAPYPRFTVLRDDGRSGANLS